MHILPHTTLGIDFGTSNSAMAWRTAGQSAQLVPLEGKAAAMPTALFFHYEDHSTHYGRDAMRQYLAGEEGSKACWAAACCRTRRQCTASW